MMDSRKPTDTLIWQTLDRDSLGVTEAMWEAFCRSGPIYDSDCRAAEAIMYEFEDWREKERTEVDPIGWTGTGVS
jgi:hypothetical protein